MPRLRFASIPTLLVLAACVHNSSGSRAGGSEPVAAPAAPAPSPAVTTPPAAIPGRSAQSPGTAASPPAANPPVAPAGPAAAAPPTPSGTSPPIPSVRSGAAAAKAPVANPPTAPHAAPVSPAASTATVAPARSAPSPSALATVPALDLAGLEQRLRETHAIGVFTKLSLKNQVDDLLAQFRAFHQGHSQVTVAQLRQKYEVLFMKVVSLLQDDDPALASAVTSSREAIWGVLTDPKKFANI